MYSREVTLTHPNFGNFTFKLEHPTFENLDDLVKAKFHGDLNSFSTWVNRTIALAAIRSSLANIKQQWDSQKSAEDCWKLINTRVASCPSYTPDVGLGVSNATIITNAKKVRAELGTDRDAARAAILNDPAKLDELLAVLYGS